MENNDRWFTQGTGRLNRMENSFIDSYEKATPFFYWFSKLFESKARDKSLDLSGLKNGYSILIIAPPTEFYIHKLLESNSEGENHLIYFSDQMKARLEKRLLGHIAYIAGVGSIEDFPYESDKFDVVFAYCYLDFLEAEERKIALEEIRRVLRFGGRLLMTYLSPPDNLVQRVCVNIFTRYRFLSQGVKIIQVKSLLRQTHFKKVDILHCSQKGLSVDLAYAEK